MSQPGPSLAEVGEDAVIGRIRRILGSVPESVSGLTDDAAVLPPMRRGTLATVDSLIEGVHFRRRWLSPEDAGAKAVAVNVSDIAAMGGTPTWGLLALTLPPELPLAAVERLARGVRGEARRQALHIVGGNVTRGAQIGIHLTLLGEPGRRPLTRTGAQPGDGIFVSGQPGLAGLGLAWLERHAPRRGDLWESRDRGTPPGGIVRRAVRRFRRPEPRTALAQALAAYRPSAFMDLSDGLATDLGRLARANGALTLDTGLLPRSRALDDLAASLKRDPLGAVWDGGEDYELLFCLRPEAARRLERGGRLVGLPVTRIGTVRGGRGGVLTPGFRPPEGDFQHFGS